MEVDVEAPESGEANPLDLMEDLASANEWRIDRSGPQDLALRADGHWCDYRIFLTWHPDVRALLFACACELRVPEHLRGRVAELVALVNERLVIGHFDLWMADGLVVYRHSLLLRGLSSASVEQLEDLADISIAECERYYPAFQFAIWGGKTPGEAIEAAILDTAGEA